MSVVIETVRCENCRRDINKTTWPLHDAVCKQHNYICDMCDSVISIREMNTHPQECPDNFIDCKDCDEIVRNADFEKHKNSECEGRIMNCIYCEIPLPFYKLSEHEQECGCRTEECKECGERVKRKHLARHVCKDESSSSDADSDIDFSAVDRPECPFCGDFFENGDQVQQHINKEHP